MKKLVSLIAIVWGAVVIYRGLTGGLPSPPQSSYEWGAAAAFGFGVLLVLLGIRHLWRVTTDADPSIGAGTAALVLAFSAAATAGAMKWKGRGNGPDATHPGSISCDAVLDHVRGLIAPRDVDGRGLAEFDARRAGNLRRCEAANDVQENTCIMAARTIEELARCAR